MYAKLKKTELLKRLFSNASLYGAGILLTRFGALLLLPVYWIKLVPADFGIIGLTQALISFLGALFSLGLNEAMQRFYYDWNSEQRPRSLAVLWVFSIGFSFLICLSLDWLGSTLFSLLFSQVDFNPYLRIALWSAFATNVALMPITLLRVQERVMRFTQITVVAFLLQAGLTLYSLFILNMGVSGYLYAQLASTSLTAVYAIFLMRNIIRGPLQWHYLKAPLRYALPLVPTAILEGFTSFMDRFFLDKYIGLQQIGLYNLGNQFGSSLNVFNHVLKSAWVPFIYRACAEREDGPTILGKFSVYYVAALAVPALAIALLFEEFILLLDNPPYNAIAEFIPAFVLLYLIQGIGTSLGRGIDLAKKTAWSILVPIVAVITGISTLTWLLPEYGIWGGIVAMLITMVCRIGTHIGLAVYFYPRPLHLASLLIITMIIAGAFISGNLLETGHIVLNILVKSLIIAAATGAILIFALDGKQAIALLRARFQSKASKG